MSNDSENVDLKKIMSYASDHFKQRISNPLVAAFSFSWVIWNYRFLAALLFLRPISDAFLFIDTNLNYAEWCSQEHWIKCLIGPIGSAMFYVYLVPILTRHAYEFTLQRKNELQAIAKKIEGAAMLSVADARALTRDLEDTVLRYEREKDSMQMRINALQRRVDEIEQPKANDSSVVNNVVPGYNANAPTKALDPDFNHTEMSASQWKLLLRIANVSRTKYVFESELSYEDDQTLDYEVDIDHLIDMGLIRQYDVSNSVAYQASSKGKRLAKAYRDGLIVTSTGVHRKDNSE